MFRSFLKGFHNMYKLPLDLDLGFFVCRVLVQVCVGLSDIIFNFDNGLSVTLTSSLGCQRPAGGFRRYKNLVRGSRDVMEFLNRTVTSAEDLSSGTLRLNFEGGGFVEFYDDSDHYESYVIQAGDRIIVV
jgi:hypothetical protein